MRNSKKMFIVGTNIVKGTRMKEVNKQLHKSFAKLGSYRGYNDVNSKNSTPGKTANKIGDTILSPSYGVNDIYISAMICRCKFFNEKVKRINFLSKRICEENGYFFIDNSIIEMRDLAQSFIYFLNNSY